jgi:quinol monooxygenase YgiN
MILCRYKDQASLKMHGASKHFKDLGRAFKNEDLLAAPMKVLFTKEVGGYGSKL